MTNKSCDTAPATRAGDRYFPSNPRGGSSSEAGSGGSSCESHGEDRSQERGELSQEEVLAVLAEYRNSGNMTQIQNNQIQQLAVDTQVLLQLHFPNCATVLYTFH